MNRLDSLTTFRRFDRGHRRSRFDCGTRPLAFWVMVLGLSLFSGCDRGTSAPATAQKTVADHLELRLDGKPVRAQIAVHQAEMARGLMERRDLGRDEGMLFVYERPQQLSFWMRNTPTPLDIGFFNARGVLEEVYPLHPFDEQSVQSRSSRLQLALEMNQGWFRENGIRPGAQLDMKSVVTALKARGFQPRRFGLVEESN